MIIGVPKEIKQFENRVALIPESVAELSQLGHTVLVETHAGQGVGFSDQAYQRAGAEIIDSAEATYRKADLIVKVKEPQSNECKLLHKGQIVFAFLHLAAAREEAELLLSSHCTAIAYETVTDDQGRLPLLAPMSEVAGRLSIQAGAHALEKIHGGMGVLLSGATGVAPAEVVVLGGGVVGSNAIRMAMGLGARVTVLDNSTLRLAELKKTFGSTLNAFQASREAIKAHIKTASLVIGAALVPGDQAPLLIPRDDLKAMQPGAVLVDVAIDQGGCFETSKPTTHEKPTFIVDGIVHYCVTNMPGAVPRTATYALNNAILPFVKQLADKGLDALRENKNLRHGVNIHRGQVVCTAVAKALDLPASTLSDI